jgi:hypothetical protein
MRGWPVLGPGSVPVFSIGISYGCLGPASQLSVNLFNGPVNGHFSLSSLRGLALKLTMALLAQPFCSSVQEEGPPLGHYSPVAKCRFSPNRWMYRGVLSKVGDCHRSGCLIDMGESCACRKRCQAWKRESCNIFIENCSQKM